MAPPAVTNISSDSVREGPPEAKRVKLELEENKDFSLAACQKLLETELPPTLLSCKTGNDLDRLRSLFDQHGFRTSIVMSPRPALSIYKDFCHISGEGSDDTKQGCSFLVIMLGLHPLQTIMERFYASSFKSIYCALLFCRRLLEACPESIENNQELGKLISEQETACQSLAALKDYATAVKEAHRLASTTIERVTQMLQLAVQADPRLRIEQLQHEYERLLVRNSTLANAHVQLFCETHKCDIKDVFFKKSHVSKYERITVYLYDPNLDLVKPPRFTFLPSLPTALRCAHALAQQMLDSFWSHLLRRGYFVPLDLKAKIQPNLEQYFLSGIAGNDLTIPLRLNAHFSPTFPLSFYFYGKAGTGKSSLARNFSPALQATVEEHVDPEILVRFVKQNLNKPFDVLKLELELRPNNNDLSVMSIIQGRRMTMGQSKPGLVIVDMEEMASNNNPEANPNQLETCQLISQRFSGRNGDYRQGAAAPRNSGKRGISGDATIIPLFTSNYELHEPCRQALAKLEMFENLVCIEMKAVSGKDREEFADAYMQQCVKDRLQEHVVNNNNLTTCKIHLDIPLGSGDTRPLVRHLRMLAFYLCSLIVADNAVKSREVVVDVSIVQKGDHCRITCGSDSIELQVGAMENLFPMTPQIFDRRTGEAIESLRRTIDSGVNFSELFSIIIDFWLAKTLAPAVVISNDLEKIKSIVATLGALTDVHCIPGVDASAYKMMKSLYDRNDTPNLRDDILGFGRGAFVAVELRCDTVDAQLCIREIVEDTPSMTAFSTEKSALYKTGLFFGVFVKGDITPELRSRASLII